MKVLIFGGTGFVGRNLTEELITNGYEVYIVTRNHQNTTQAIGKNVQIIEWDINSSLTDIQVLKKIDVVINLAGESIGNRRWTYSVKQEILASRIKTTSAIVNAINSRIIQPKLLINASAVGYYGPHNDEELTEVDEAGRDFLAQVCRAWENEAYKVQSNSTRVVTIRIGVVLGKEGALNKMVMPFKIYMGGPLGTGMQWMSWIHIQDLTSLIRFIIEQPILIGPINATAPESVRMRDFCKDIGKVLNRPSWLPVPEFILNLALGEMAEMLLHGQRVVPKKAIDAGFESKFPGLESALRNVLEI